jgi:PEGA domain
MKHLVLALLLPLSVPAQEKLAEPPLPPPPAVRVAQPPAVKARPTHRLAVLDFTLAGSAHADLARVLADAAAAGAAATPDLQVLSQGDIAAMLGLEKTRQMLGCTEDQGCMAELAGALDSDRLLSGSLTILERTSLLTVKVLDVKKSRTLSRVTATLLDATERELVDAARRLGHEAVTGEKLDTTGVIRIAVDRSGATVTLDGRSLGTSPIKEAARVLEGPHSITVQKDGFVRWSTTVMVQAGQTVPVSADLVPVQLLGEAARSRLWTWGWISAGVAVAASGSGIYFGTQASRSFDAYKVETVRSRAVDLHNQAQRESTIANVSWGVAGAGALAAGGLLVGAMLQDAAAAAPPPTRTTAAPVLIPGGAMLAVGGQF